MKRRGRPPKVGKALEIDRPIAKRKNKKTNQATPQIKRQLRPRQNK